MLLRMVEKLMGKARDFGQHPQVSSTRMALTLQEKHRLDKERLEKQQAEILRDTILDQPVLATVAGVSSGDDWERLRGLPVVSRGVGGTLPGTQPERELMRRESQRRRKRR